MISKTLAPHAAAHDAVPAPQITLNGRFLMQNVTGVQRVAREVLLQLDAMARDALIPTPRVLLPAKGDLVAPLALQAITPERVGRHGGHLWEQLDLPRAAGPDPLLCLGNTAPVRRLYQAGHPTVTMVHDLSYKYFPAAYNWKFRALYSAMMPRILRHSAAVVTVSEAEATSIRSHYPQLQDDPRLSFLQNGGIPDADAAAARARTDMPGPEARPYGLYVGSLTKRKNARGLLEGAMAFLEAYPTMRFVVIGATGASFEGLEIAVPAHLQDRLEFRGQINDAAEIYKAYAHARFLLFPSFYEASPLPPIEAMTFGCPVVASSIPSILERCGDAAIYCAPDSPASMVAAIDTLMADAASWRAASDTSRAWTERFSWRAQAEGLMRLCASVCGSSEKAAA